ncbi:hypothetical protein [uncultured Litoreibacter sp.]|uniref:hypothetical protein n=1 Tax=uncultured Litoreibacter sp. TaxID=1392394 RepID=UPI00260E74B2|nr:hypothetical protein [uncultured Litoreibacter sp.]
MQPLHPLIKDLLDLETLKTWSVIATLFGDFDGEQMTGSQIREPLGHLGIKPEAIRVALHRLKINGWIIADRQGREAVYRLSPHGRSETRVAAKDVYRQDVKFPEGWQFVLTREDLAVAEAVPISKDVMLVPTGMIPEGPETLALNTTGADLPLWIVEQLVPPRLLQNVESLTAVLQKVAMADQDISCMDAKCLRLLTLHHWRRLALRPGSWAHISLHPHGGLARCHAVITGYLSHT